MAVVEAWTMVCSGNFNLFNDEDRTTAEIEEALLAILEHREGAPVVPMFSDKYFETPPRDAKQRDHSRVKNDNMPDLTFRLAGELGRPRPFRAVFVECKVLDGGRGVNLYCKNGIRRFVDGKYAHRMSHAMMLGYVLDGSSKIPDDLDDYFLRGRSDCAVDCKPNASYMASYLSPPGYDIYITTHSRPYDSECAGIDLHHLWLEAPSP